ncbi:HD domain-containing protein [Deinococcus sonorensis]|uniref:HD domain-containing protein n=2 Tax=Deinococcus sonorensis TaxID=309891 RepID=A0AAU7UCI1_9DEIO
MTLRHKVLGLPAKLRRLARSLHPAQARPDDHWALERLQAGERQVYLSMDPRDREHAVRVARAVAQQPGTPELLAAALLHDCGKAVRPYRVWERVLVGLVPYRWAGRVRWGALTVRADHPALGAQALALAGARPRVAQLVARHHRPGDDPEAGLLHRYDDLE